MVSVEDFLYYLIPEEGENGLQNHEFVAGNVLDFINQVEEVKEYGALSPVQEEQCHLEASAQPVKIDEEFKDKEAKSPYKEEAKEVKLKDDLEA